ncbi:MAG TPA: MaoC family dehydratase [Dehalococcoidia bacterium]|nr:MaoC family dehydratase [Dehalococcoidia bacterium]
MSTALTPVVRVIEQAHVEAYADASGDHNPVHVDPGFAAASPFGGTIAHGMLVLAMIGELMHNAHGERWLASGRLKVRFKAPTRPGDTVTAAGEESRRDGGVVEYGVRCTNQAGEVLIEGRATVADGVA